MKKIFFIAMLAISTSCATKKEVYYIIVDQPQKEKFPRINRFAKQFQEADSVFMRLKEISKRSVMETNQEFQ